MESLRRYSVSIKDIPKDELESTLNVLIRSFNVISVVIRRKGRI